MSKFLNFSRLAIIIPKKNKQYSYLIFFLISCFFWSLNVLSKKHEETIIIDLKYVNMPKDKILQSNLSGHINVSVKASGFNLLIHYLFNNDNLILDFNKANNKLLNKKNEFFWITSSLRKDIVSILPMETEIFHTSPERIFSFFIDKDKKTVPLKLKSKISLSKNMWYKSPIEIHPDSITVFASKEILDSVNFIETELLDIDNLEKSKIFYVNVDKKQNIETDIQQIKVMASIEPFIEDVFEQSISIRNLNKNLSLKIFPSKASVIFRIPRNKYELFNSKLSDLYVDASLISKSSFLDVQISNLPDYVKVYKVEPERVEFLILK